MKTHTSQFKEEIKKFGRQIDSKITYTIDNEEIELGAEQLNSITPHYEGALLKSVMKQLDIDSNVEIPLETEINYKFGLLVNGSYEYVDFGNYIVYSIEKQEDLQSYKITCYDKMLYSMIPYESMNLTYPISIRDYLGAICTKLGLTFKNSSDTFANYDKEIANELYLDNEGNSLDYTFRDVLDQLAEVTASTICINEDDDELELRYIDKEQNEELLNIEYYNFDNSFYSAINLIINNNVLNINGGGYNQNIVIDASPTIEKTIKAGTYVFTLSELISDGDLVIYFYKNDVEIQHTTLNSLSKNITLSQDVDSYKLKFTIKPSKYYDVTTKMSLKSNVEKTFDTIDEEYLKDININFGEKFGPVNSIVLTRSGGSDSVYLSDDDSVTQNGLCEIKIEDNQIMNFNDRSNYLQDILNKLNGLEYYINDFVSTGITYYNLCDRYNISIDNNIYKCIMFNDEINVTQGLEEQIHTDLPEETNTDYEKANKTDRTINQTWIIVNKQKGEIESLTSKTSALELATGDMYKKEEVNRLVQDAQSGLTNTFSVTGGANIFRNTGLWFKSEDVNNPYEFWTGIVERTQEENAINMNALLLQSGTIEQSQVVKNDTYTISFKYKKILPLATVKVVINDTEYELTETIETEFVTGKKDSEGNYIIPPLEITSNENINLKFISDTDDSCEIYDLMVNIGDVPLVYSQNENETTTDTVNISKGITITSSENYDVKFKADYYGIRTLDGNDRKITSFTNVGMETNEAIINGKSKIVKVLQQDINDQTWYTRL